jgi:uncharacterized protein YcnI
MKVSLSQAVIIGLFVSVISLAVGTTASAHVVVRPSEVVTTGFQTFTVSVPNEKDISTTRLTLNIPDGLKYVQPTQKVGWSVTTETENSGENEIVKSITWSGNEVKAGFRDEFTFSGQVPEKAIELRWKAYQTYSDGTVVSWDKELSGDDHANEDKNSGPFSVTKVVAETADDTALKNVEQATANAKGAANTALYIGIAGVAVGLIGVFVGTRKK